MPPITRYRYTRRHRGGLSCGCLVLIGSGLLIVAIVALLIPLLPMIGMRLAGFAPIGTTDDLFVGVTPIAPPSLDNAASPAQVAVDLGGYGVQTIPAVSTGYRVTVANDAGTVIVSIDESGFMALCQQVTTDCATGGGRFRNPTIDLHPGGAVIYADVPIPGIGIWQRVGVVMQIRGAASLTVAGVDVAGTLYTVPPDGLGDFVADIERVANDVLRQASLQSNGVRYQLAEIYVDESTATLILR